jgi:hypothetical protein
MVCALQGPLLVASVRGLGGEGAALFYWLSGRLVLVWIAIPISLVWAFHHAAQPAHLVAVSIGVVNSCTRLAPHMPSLDSLSNHPQQPAAGTSAMCSAVWWTLLPSVRSS